MPSKKLTSIGVFDSGFGGIDILRAIVKEFPQYQYIYLGDTARTPYGTRSEETIYEFTRQAVDFLFSKNCDLIILACNTASSEALRKIQQHYLPLHYPNKKVLGVLVPAVEVAAQKTKTGRVGVIATASTVHSQSFVKQLAKIDTRIRMFQQACPLLVPLIESGEHRTPAAHLILENYLKPLIAKHIDTLILGCTHYGILESRIRKIVGPDITLISEAKIVPKKLAHYLEYHPEIRNTLSQKASVTFYSTDLTDTFSTLGSQYFGKKIQAKKITLS